LNRGSSPPAIEFHITILFDQFTKFFERLHAKFRLMRMLPNARPTMQPVGHKLHGAQAVGCITADAE
jgi:hypothetical protein